MGQANSGQYNSESLICNFRCDVCDTLFTDLGELRRHCIEDKVHSKLSKGKGNENSSTKNNWDFANSGAYHSRRYTEQVVRVPDYARPDNIWRCLSCNRFFYSEVELNEHAGSDPAEHWMTDKTHSESCYCAVCRRTYPCNIEIHTQSVRLHNERPNISIKDRETERVQICCVRCGIYFGSTEKKRKHFRDVEHHSVRDKDSDSNTDSDDNELIEWEEVDGPESLPSLPVSINSAYAPEFSRRRVSVHNSQPAAGPSGSSNNRPQTLSVSSKAQAEIIDYECPLCLENDDSIAALPCGHIFGIQCIQDALSSDNRCPLCRCYASDKDIRKIYLFT